MTPTNYAQLSRRQARLVLAAFCAVALAAVGITFSPLANRNAEVKRDRPGDIGLYLAEIERIRHGDGYYQAVAAELPTRGYPTRSVFNWRTPLPLWLLGHLPSNAWGKALLGSLALALMLLAFEALSREEEVACGATGNADPAWKQLVLPAACALLLSGPLLGTVGDAFVMPEFWAGIFIAMSACAYGMNRPAAAVALGLLALFFRELAMPYVAVCMAIAWRQGRRGEFRAWLLGLAAWCAFFAIHAWQVGRWMPADAQSHAHGWVQCGGAGFVIATAQMNSYLILLPQWVTALYLVASLIGLAGWSTPLGTRIGLTVCLFAAGLALVGQSFNQYWGIIFAPLLCFGLVRFPASIRDLGRAAIAPA